MPWITTVILAASLRFASGQHLAAPLVGNAFSLFVRFGTGRLADHPRFLFIELDYNQGLVAALGVLRLGAHPIDQRVWHELAVLANAAPLDDVVRLTREIPRAGGERGRAQVRLFLAEIQIEPTARVEFLMDHLIAAKPGAQVLEVVDLRIFFPRGVFQHLDLGQGRGREL